MSMGRRSVLAVALAAGALTVAGVRAQAAPPAEVLGALPGARLLGSGQLRFLGFRIYDARLWAGAQAPAADWVAAAFALELEYGRGLDGAQIAERSLVEMRRQGEPSPEVAARWLAQMKMFFPDVKEGDRITGVNVPGSGVKFFINGSLRGEVRDTDFARVFFGIWLSPLTSEPGLRDALLGRPAK